MLIDLTFALRQLRMNPGFTLVVVLTLALVIGATTAVFTLIDALLLRLLPVSHPEQLVGLTARGPRGAHWRSIRHIRGQWSYYAVSKTYRGQQCAFEFIISAFLFG